MYKTKVNKKKEEFHYYEYGYENKKTLLFLPGYADSALMYEKLGKSLAKKYRVIALDLPMIYKKDKIYDLKMLTEFVEDFVKVLKINNFTISGFSSCGLVAINYAYNKPNKIKEIVLLNSVPRFILSKTNRRIFHSFTPLFSLRPILYICSRFITIRLIRKILKLSRISSFTITRMRDYYYSVFGTAVNLIGESVLVRFKKIRVPKKIIFFKDDTKYPGHVIKILSRNLIVK